MEGLAKRVVKWSSVLRILLRIESREFVIRDGDRDGRNRRRREAGVGVVFRRSMLPPVFITTRGKGTFQMGGCHNGVQA